MKDILIGESLVGEGNEVAHIDLLIGPKNGPVGAAFANALVNQNAGHTAILAALEPNLLAQAVQMFGPAQAAVAKAVADSVADGIIPQADAEGLVCIVGVFIHWEAKDNKKIYDYNYRATKESIARAMKGEPSVKTVIERREKAKHPFA